MSGRLSPLILMLPFPPPIEAFPALPPPLPPSGATGVREGFIAPPSTPPPPLHRDETKFNQYIEFFWL